MEKQNKTTVALCGASGYIGSALRCELHNAGYAIVAIDRNLLSEAAQPKLIATLKKCDVVINVAGAPIDQRWTPEYKQTLYDSRVTLTRRLVTAITQCDNIQTFINTSAIGVYPSTGCHGETSNVKGCEFLANLCQAWENEVQKTPARVRTIITRLGVVLSPHGKTFLKLTLPFRYRVAAQISTGLQPFSWIALSDLTRAMLFLIKTPTASGIYNLTSPENITNATATKILARHFKTWIHITIPSRILRLLMGESADIVLNGQCAMPKRLLKAGFVFKMATLTKYLEKLIPLQHHETACNQPATSAPNECL